jgi:hypothetical protein
LRGGERLTIEKLHEQVDAGKVTEAESWVSFIRGDVVDVATNCNAIYNLKNWKNSRGARLENTVGRALKFKVFKEGDLFTKEEYAEIKRQIRAATRK